MHAAPLTTLDWVCVIMDEPLRPLDFALVLHFKDSMDAEALKLAARSARNLHPSTACRLDGRHWSLLREDVGDPPLRQASTGQVTAAIEEFLAVPFCLSREPPLRQLVISNREDRSFCLATRVHHCAADLLSALAWVRHQLRVAAGHERFVGEPARYETPALAKAPARARRNPYWGRSDRIWTEGTHPSGSRRWRTLSISAGEFAGLSRMSTGFTYNDVLLVATLETLHRWNELHQAARDKIGLWLPINVRRDKFVGFGNGTSRIRVHRRYSNDAGLADKCRTVRSQVNWSRQHGEWTVPQQSLLARLPMRIAEPVARRYLRRPWADMGTAAFTHVQEWPGQSDPEFAGLQQLEVIGALDRRHALMLAAVTQGDRTWLTMTYDPELLSKGEIDWMVQFYLHFLSSAAQQI